MVPGVTFTDNCNAQDSNDIVAITASINIPRILVLLSHQHHLARAAVQKALTSIQLLDNVNNQHVHQALALMVANVYPAPRHVHQALP